MGMKIGIIERVGRLITLPEQVDKLEEKIDHVREIQTTCVKDDELTQRLKEHKDHQDEKLDIIIDLLKNNKGYRE
jgi:hypothetical protein